MHTEHAETKSSTTVPPGPGGGGASCFWMYFCFLNIPGDSGHPPAFCFSAIKEKCCCHCAPSSAAPQWAVSPEPAELCPHSLCRAPVWAGDAWARQAANDYCSCYFKPLVYNQNVFLPKIQSRSAARLLILTQVPPVSQVWSSLTT